MAEYKDLSKKIRSVVAIHNVSQLRFLFGLRHTTPFERLVI